TPRKRHGGAVNSRQGRKRSRLMASTTGTASEAGPTELEGSDVIDLTDESSNPIVINLTHDDSVVVSKNQQQGRNFRPRDQHQLDICIQLSKDEDEPRDNHMYVMDKVPSRTVSCPICMDGYSEIVQSGRLIVSTKCGHVFCSQCLRDSLRNANSCPTCRKKLTHRQYHPIYI
ncbi:RNF4 ligase, partial [Nyctibius bracteatus]|nr:RNF4 ligase [Nyctibius bracteatus]